MSAASEKTIHALEQVVKSVPVGTNLALLHLLWAMVSGAFLKSRSALFPALQYAGFTVAQIRRAGQALRTVAWHIGDLVAAWRVYVYQEDQRHILCPQQAEMTLITWSSRCCRLWHGNWRLMRSWSTMPGPPSATCRPLGAPLRGAPGPQLYRAAQRTASTPAERASPGIWGTRAPAPPHLQRTHHSGHGARCGNEVLLSRTYHLGPWLAPSGAP